MRHTKSSNDTYKYGRPVQAEQKLKLLQQTQPTTTTTTLLQEQEQLQQPHSLIVYANDWNQIAIDYMTKSIKLNLPMLNKQIPQHHYLNVTKLVSQRAQHLLK